MTSQPLAPAPLFRDPVTDGAADPTVVAGPDGRWWMFYTQRRPADPGPGVRWVHGSRIGVAHSVDGGASWVPGGTVAGLAPEGDTLWAPEVVAHEGTFHMYVTHIRGIPNRWEGHPRRIVHHTSTDLLTWHEAGVLVLSSDRVIDACVHRLPGGRGWRLWYKDEADDSATWAADSPDLHTWQVRGPVLRHRPHEGPNVFQLGGRYWMVVDAWDGQEVFRSDDLDSWEPAGRILETSGTRPGDAGPGFHADVVAAGDEAWIFYFTHPGRTGEQGGAAAAASPAARRSAVQVARLTVAGGRLHCERDTAPAPRLPIPTPERDS